MRMTLSYLLILLIGLESIISIGEFSSSLAPLVSFAPIQVANAQEQDINNVSVEHPFQFADYHKVKSGPYYQVPLTSSLGKEVGIISLISYTTCFFYAPFGFLFRGLMDNFSSLTGLIKKMNNLNKLAKEFNMNKSLILLPYIGIEGAELLEFYLRGEQTVTDLNGRTRKITVLDSENRRKSSLHVLIIREMVDAFIKQFQENALKTNSKIDDVLSAKNRVKYQEDLGHFLRHLGLVVFSKETIRLGAKVENRTEKEFLVRLYRVLQKKDVLTSAGGLRYKGTFHKLLSHDTIVKALNAGGIVNDELQIHVIHDLGFVSPKDIERVISKSIEELKTSDGGVHLGLIPEVGNHFIDHHERLKPHFKNLTQYYFFEGKDVKNEVDRAILRTLIPVNEFDYYLRTNHLSIDKKNIDDEVTLLKICYLQHVKAENYHYFKLENDLERINALLMKYFNEQKIQNDNFKILSLNKEDITIGALSYVMGVGFVTAGASRLITTFFAEYLGAEILQAVGLFGGGALLVTRVISFILHGMQAVKVTQQLFNLRTSQKVTKELKNFFESKSSSWKLSKEEEAALTFMRFHILSQEHIQKHQKKLLTHMLGYEALWFPLLTLNTALTVWAFLIVIGIGGTFGAGLVASFAIAGPIGQWVLGGTAFILIAMALRELQLEIKLSDMKDLLSTYENVLSPKLTGNFTPRQQHFLNLFFKNSKSVINLGIEQDYVSSRLKLLSESTEREKIGDFLNYIYGNRHSAHKYFKRLVYNEKGFNKELCANANIPIGDCVSKSDLVEKMRPAYHFTPFDDVIKNMNPSLVQKDPKDFPLPEGSDEYWFDIHLTDLFINCFFVYNNVRKNVREYNYVLRKHQLQQTYFNQGVRTDEISLVDQRMAHRHNRIDDNYFISEIISVQNSLIDSMEDIGENNPFFIFVEEKLLDEIKALIKFDREIVNELHHLEKVTPEIERLSPPSTPILMELFKYYIPSFF